MTIVYLMRHSIADKNVDYSNIKDSFEKLNRGYILSLEGERQAYLYSKIKQLSGISLVVASNYVRSIATAKYVADKNKCKVIVDANFDERKFGVSDASNIPADFFKKQFLNHDYKLKSGESFAEVKVRALKGLAQVIKKNKGKKSLVVTHSSTIAFLLSKWCSCEYSSKYIVRYNDNVIIDGFTTPDLIELKFDDSNKLVDIKRVLINNKTKKKSRKRKK